MSFGNLSSAYVFSHFDKDYKEIMLVPNLDFIKTTYDITLDSYSRFGTSTISLSFVKMVEHELLQQGNPKRSTSRSAAA